MDQRSDEWLNWRKRGIGSSDAPIVMGLSPWSTPRQLWEIKTGKTAKTESGSTYAQDRGNRLEPIARAKYELETGFEMGPATCAHYKEQWLRASMDGFNPNCPPFGSFNRVHKRGLEIKCPGIADHESARNGMVPEKYAAQVQHQFIVTGADVIDYYSYYLTKEQYETGQWHNGEAKRIEVFPDLMFIKKYLVVAEEFWRCVLEDRPPSLTEKDYKLVRSVAVKELARAWKEQHDLFHKLEEQLTPVKAALQIAKQAVIDAIGADVRLARIENTGVSLVFGELMPEIPKEGNPK